MDDSDSQYSHRIYSPQPGERQLTLRALVAGCAVGSIVSCTNVYLSLMIGWSFGASIITAVLSYSVFALFNSHLSLMETNIAQTTGSAAGYMSTAAGLVAPIPAMMMLDFEINFVALVPWAIGVACLGICFAVPLRRQYVEVEKLRFPTGLATAETLVAMYSHAGEALAKTRALVGAGILAGVLTLLGYFLPEVHEPPFDEWLSWGLLATAATWGFNVTLGPSLFGAGFLMGPRVVLSLLGGAVLGYALLGPFAQSQGWAPAENPLTLENGARGWILWPGAALLVSESLAALAFSWRTFLRVFTTRAALGDEATADVERIPNRWWIGGLVAASVWTIVLAQALFGIAWYLTLVAIPLSAVLAAVATRSLGETDVNPVGGVGKVTQLVFGGLAPGQIGTNLMAAAITGGGASQAADMMQDLKTGYLLGASPRKQFLAQLVGISFGVFFAVPAFRLFSKAYEFGGEELPAPAAMAWKAMAQVLANGIDSLPPHAATAAGVACLCGITIACLRRIPSIRDYVPSGLAMGIGFITLPDHALNIFYGLAVWYVWRTVHPRSAERLTFAVAAGLIAGEGLMGIVNAILKLSGVPTFWDW